MIVLKKGNHYEHTSEPDKAAKLAQEGYEVVKGKSLLGSVKKQSEPKKKSSKKSKKK
mgnify:CR=1 FL=1|tara:strand:- start:207 stop:377 length:171 start_codon:yes stop_codon:yes gene_type:complete